MGEPDVNLRDLSTEELLALADQMGLSYVLERPLPAPQRSEREYFIVHDGQDHTLLADGEFVGIVHERGAGTWISDHRGIQIFHENGLRATFTHPKTGVDHIGRGVDPYQDAACTEEHPQR